MTHIVNIAFQGGTQGNFLRFCIDKFSTLTPRLDGLPFNQNMTSHVELQYSGLVKNYDPTDTGFMHTDEPHILITIDQEDLLFVERWVTIRAGDFGVDTSEELVTLTPDFLKKFPWQEKLKKYYNLDTIIQLLYIQPHLCRILIAFPGNGSQKSLPRKAFLGKPRPAGRLLAKKPKGVKSFLAESRGQKLKLSLLPLRQKL